MAALEDGGGAVVFSDPLMEIGNVASVAFGNQDMGGATEVFRRFAQCASGKQVFIAEGCLPVDQDQIIATVKFKILQTVIQKKQVTAQFGDCMTSAGDAILFYHHSHPSKVLGQHEGFIPGCFGIKQEGSSFGHNAYRHLFFPWLSPSHAFVTTTQNRDATPPIRQLAGEFFHNGSFSGSSDCEVPDTDHRASHLVLPHDVIAKQVEAKGDNPTIEERNRE